MISTVISVIMDILVIVGNKMLIELMFEKMETFVMDACITYLGISACSLIHYNLSLKFSSEIE